MNQQSATNRGPLPTIAGICLLVLIIGAAGFVILRLASPSAPAEAPRDAAGTIASINESVEAARHYLKQNEPGRAAAILREAAREHPGEQNIHLLLGECLLALDQPGDALDAYEHAIALGPDHAEYRHVAGTIAAEQGELQRAEAHYAMAQRLNPSNPKHPLYLAQVQRKLGELDAARASLATATNLDPDLAIAWAALAGIALEENRLSVAQDYIDKARELEPRRSTWRVVEAKILRRRHKPEQAAQLLYAIPEADRLADPDIVEELAMCLSMIGRTTEAANLYLDAASFHEDDPKVLHDAAVWLDRDGRTDRAVNFAAAAELAGYEPAARLRESLEAKLAGHASADPQ